MPSARQVRDAHPCPVFTGISLPLAQAAQGASPAARASDGCREVRAEVAGNLPRTAELEGTVNAMIASEVDVWTTDCAIHDLCRRPVDEIPLSVDDLAEWIATLQVAQERLIQAARAVS
jgi:hypothetical protein